MNQTIDYYNTNAKKFNNDTVAVEFSEVQNRFTSYLKEGAHILDFGCGSGRDSLAFQKKGYDVDAIDGSEEMCKLASKLIGKEVQCLNFLDFDKTDEYDGIWACATLLHLTSEELLQVMGRLEQALKEDGYIYVSFKYGEFEGNRNGRHFTDMTEDRLKNLLITCAPRLEIVDMRVGGDCRPGREDEMWLNVIMKKGK